MLWQRVMTFLFLQKDALYSAFQSVRHAPISSFMTVALLGMTLALPLGLLVGINGIDNMLMRERESLSLMVLLKPALSKESMARFVKTLEDTPGVDSVDFQSKEQLLADLKRKPDFQEPLRLLRENPIPDTIFVYPAISPDDASRLQDLISFLEDQEAVDVVLRDEEAITDLSSVKRFVHRIGALVLGFISGLVILVVGVTVRQTIEKERDRLLITQLLGASSAYVRRPFLYVGTALGLLGGALAIFLIHMLVHTALPAAKEVISLEVAQAFLSSKTDMSIMMIASLLFGWMGAWLSVGLFPLGRKSPARCARVSQMQKSRFLGSILLIAGTAIGAGMLALPATTGQAGLLPTLIAFVVIWAMMMASALLLLEVNLSLPDARDLLSMAKKTLGKPGLVVTWFTFLCLLYALNAAYITGGARWLDEAISTIPLSEQGPRWLHFVWLHHQTFSAIFFTFILGAVIYLGTHAVDGVNRLFMLILIGTFLAIESVGLRAYSGEGVWIDRVWTILPAASVIMTSFGFHIVIPTLTEYLKRDKKQLKKAVMIGSTLPLLVYILWIATVLGWLSADARQQMFLAEDKLSAFIQLSAEYGAAPSLVVFLKLFSLSAILTSFLGVAMSLFHFLEDGLHHKVSHPIIVSMITFLPPLLFALVFPQGFVFALGFAGIFVAILLGILPCLMAWTIRYRLKNSATILLPGGRFAIAILIVLFLLVIAFEVYYAHILPHLS